MSCLNFILFFTLVGCIYGGCPSGWKYFSESCYYFSSSKLNWYLASAACAAHHGNLAIVELKEEGQFLRNESIHLGRGFWLDGVDDVVEGLWTWASTNQNMTYTDWYPGQPSNGSSHNEDCVHIYPGLKYHWNDIHCTYNEYYTCEIVYDDDDDDADDECQSKCWI